MEAVLEPVVEVERLLIFENKEEISKTIEDARIRANFLNEIISSGLTSSQIKEVATSEKSIEDFLFQQHLKLNKTMAQEFAAGKKQRHLVEAYLLPTALENKQRLLQQWLNFPISRRRTDKYQFLRFNDGRFELDSDALERDGLLNRLKFYVTGEQLNEFRDIEKLCECFEKYKMPNNQIRESSFLWNRIEPVGMHQYKPRATWFMRDRN